MHVRYLRSSTSERDAPASGEREIADTVVADIGATRCVSATRVARKGGATIDGDRASIIINGASLPVRCRTGAVSVRVQNSGAGIQQVCAGKDIEQNLRIPGTVCVHSDHPRFISSCIVPVHIVVWKGLAHKWWDGGS